MSKEINKIAILIGVVVAFWSLVTPIFEFPDEQAHVGTVTYLVQEGRIPVGEELDMTREMQGIQQYLGVYRDQRGNNLVTYHPEYRVEATGTYLGLYEPEIRGLNNKKDRTTYVGKEAARYPRLYYDYLGVFHRLVDSADIFTRVYVMRLGNVVLALLTALVVYRMGILLFASARHAQVLTLLVMLQPMYTFLSAGVNSDNLHNLLFSLVIYLGLRVVGEGITPKLGFLSIVVVALDILSKPQGYIAIPILISAYLLHIVVHRQWRQFWLLLVLALAGALAIISPFNPYKSWLAPSNLRSASLSEYLSFSLNKLVAQNIVWYWGVFKWLGVVLPPIYWQVANRLVLLSGVGLIVYIWKSLKKISLPTRRAYTLFLLLSSAIYAGAIYYFDYQYVKVVGYSIGVQARYLFPTITAHMALLMIGLLSLTWRKSQVPWVLRGLTLCILWLQLGGLWRLITSYYDTTSLSVFITQASQYKPDFAKGEWWYLWCGLYLLALIYIVVTTLRHLPDKKTPVK